MTIAQVLVVLSAVGTLIYYGTPSYVSTAKYSKMPNNAFSKHIVRQSIYNSLLDQDTLATTLSEPGQDAAIVSCYLDRTPADCSPIDIDNKVQLTQLNYPSGELFLDLSDTTVGLSSSGEPCTGFPGINCPFRYEFFFYANCKDLGCTDYQFHIEGIFLEKPQEHLSVVESKKNRVLMTF